jgi:hypothetical protein
MLARKLDSAESCSPRRSAYLGQSVDAWEKGISLPTLPAFFELARVFGWPTPN